MTPITVKEAVILFLCLMFWSGSLVAEPHKKDVINSVVTKEGVDEIFHLTKLGWEELAKRAHYPGWTIRLDLDDSGTILLAHDSDESYSLSIQPVYSDDRATPKSILVGTYYPLGFLGEVNDQFIIDIKSMTQKGLGSDYSVPLILYRKDQRHEVIELLISQDLDCTAKVGSCKEASREGQNK